MKWQNGEKSPGNIKKFGKKNKKGEKQLFQWNSTTFPYISNLIKHILGS